MADESKESDLADSQVDLQMRTNHCGHFMLTQLLLPSMDPTSSVIIVMASRAHRQGSLVLSQGEDISGTSQFLFVCSFSRDGLRHLKFVKLVFFFGEVETGAGDSDWRRPGEGSHESTIPCYWLGMVCSVCSFEVMQCHVCCRAAEEVSCGPLECRRLTWLGEHRDLSICA